MSILPGENVGPYRVVEQLGSGGMATVFKAYHPSLDRYVALKVLHPAFKANPQFFERFKREARIVANLEHPHIIPVYDFDEHQGEPYLVMRFIEGSTLKPTLEGKPMPPDQILHLMRPVCQAVAYAHKQGVLHRDLKPSNIMISQEGPIFLTDFGLARMVQSGESTLSQDVMVGTPQYISPEQAQGNPQLDARTDVYSLGVILFEMLTGRVPFNADTPFATVHDHIYAPLPLPRSLNPEIDPAVERLLLKALAKNPDERFATALELLGGLESTLGPALATNSMTVSLPGTARFAPAVSAKSRLPWWVWIGTPALIVMVVGLILISLMLVRNNHKKISSPVQAATLVEVIDKPQATDPELPLPSPTPVQPTPTQAAEPVPTGQTASELTVQARQAQQQGQAAEAKTLYEQAIQADPHYLPASFGLSELLIQADDQAGALAVLEQAVSHNPQEVEGLMRLGRLQQRAEEPAAALASFEAAAALDPQAALPRAAQAVALLNLGEKEAAREAAEQALALDPTLPEAHLAYGMVLYQQGDTRRALQQLRQVVRSERATPPLKEQARAFLTRLNN